MRKRWILIALSVGLLALVIGGGAALAAGGGEGFGRHGGRGHHNPSPNTLERVAAILGIPAQTIADAFTQSREEAAQEQLENIAGRVAGILGTDAGDTANAIRQVADEMRSERLEAKLQAALDSGRITEEQAQTYREQAASENYWHGLKDLGNAEEFANRVGAILGVEGSAVAEALQQAIAAVAAEALEVKLQEALDSGRITEEQAQAYRDRAASGEWRGFGKHGFGKHGHGKRGRGHHHGGWGKGHHGLGAGL